MPEPQEQAARKPRECGAQTRSGGACKKPLRRNQKRCKLHGGASPQAVAQERARDLEDEARGVFADLDVTPVDNPLAALSQLAGEVLAWKDLLSQHVARLQDSFRYEGEAAEQIRGEVLLYERGMDRALQVLAAISRLKIDERLAAIEQAKVQQMARILEGALDEIGLDYETKRKAFAEMSRLARKVEMGRLPAAG
jgi:hypothetical protein